MKNRVSNKLFSAVISWVSRINTTALKEDFRKAGMVLVGAGYAGVIVGGDSMSSLEGLILILTGTVAWAFGLTKEEDNGN
ncbi:MAG: hypothetical protein ABW104_18030 [Candidatus Thiodiazotropha sp. 6PLUC2]|jgi:hypothetical protein|nr:hypothetical protein [Candidatus Thiodiazotropha lotti]MCW4218806.1 hypothetical protein [Candidatus Thiodiazotropha lotti]